MPGVLEGAFGEPAQGGGDPGIYASGSGGADASDPYANLDPITMMRMGLIDPNGGAGALSGVTPPQPSQVARQQADLAQGLTGPPGALQQRFDDLSSSRDKDAQAKLASINQAMAILQATHGSQTTNLPLLAAAAAGLKPTRTGGFAESLGNAFEAAIPATETQRQRDMDYAKMIGSLGVDAAEVPGQTTQQKAQDLFDRLRLGEQAGSSAAIADWRQGQTAMRGNIADLNSATRLTAEQIKQRDANIRQQWRDSLTQQKIDLQSQGLTEKQALDLSLMDERVKTELTNRINALGKSVPAGTTLSDLYDQARAQIEQELATSARTARPTTNAPAATPSPKAGTTSPQAGTPAPLPPKPNATAPAPTGQPAVPAAPAKPLSWDELKSQYGVQ